MIAAMPLHGPEVEARRLAALRRLEVLDSDSEQDFDALAQLAADTADMPIASITLVDESRAWFKGRVGVDVGAVPRGNAFCSHVVAQGAPLVVPDALADARFARNPFVVEGPRLRFYAGVPLLTAEGDAIGALAVADRVPRELGPTQVRALQALARSVVLALELRRDRLDQRRSESALLGIMEDQLRTEQVLREQAALLSNAQRIGRMGSWSCDLLRSRIEWSDATCEIFGIERGRFDGTVDAFRELVLPEDLPGHLGAVERATAAGGELESEFRIRRPDGEVRWIYERGIVENDDAGRPVRALGMAMDVTERRRNAAELAEYRMHLEQLVAQRTAQLEQARSQAEEASRAKSAFLANMSHEIRTPMNGVLGMIEVLEQTNLDTDQADMIATMRDSGQVLLRLIDDVLDFSRIEAGRLEIVSEPVALDRLLEALHASQRLVAERHGVVLLLAVTSDLPRHVRTDPVRLRQILLNLLSNAIKFSAGRQGVRGRVELRAGRAAGDPRRIELTVADNGIGIAPDALGRLFQPFVQAEGSTTRRFGGTGLGLTISRRLATLLGGTLDVESTVIGVGSTFLLSLPADIPGEQEAVIEDPSAATLEQRAPPVPAFASIAEARARCELILVAEDDPVSRDVVVRQLELIGRRAEVARDGSEALRMWRAGRYALLLTDLHMPGIDGYTLTRSIRTDERTAGEPRRPIIALTANALRGEAERSQAVGIDAYLTKPIQLHALRKAIDRLLPRAATAARAGTMCDAPEPTASPAPLSSAPQAPAGSAGPVDYAVLVRMLGQQEADVDSFLELFLRLSAPTRIELANACDRADARRAGEVAHKMKSSARSIGAIALGEVCAAIELAARAGDTAGVRERLPRFEAELTCVEDALRDRLARTPHAVVRAS